MDHFFYLKVYFSWKIYYNYIVKQIDELYQTEIQESKMKLKDTTIKEFFKTLDYYNSPLFENSFSDKFIYNSNIFSVNEKLSVRFLKVVINNQGYSENIFEELLETPYNKLQNKFKDSLAFSFIFKKGNNFVFKKWNAGNSNGFGWEKQVIPADLLTEI